MRAGYVDLIVEPGNGCGSAASAHAVWLRRSGYFREVLGYQEAVDLLNDPRLHANMAASLGVDRRDDRPAPGGRGRVSSSA